MIAVSGKEEELYGCPNCGCNKWSRDSSFRGDQPTGVCKSCGTRYQIMADGVEVSSIGIGTGRKDENDDDIYEYAKRIPHPRMGLLSWDYVYPDLRPEKGEYWTPRSVGYDLSGFVKSKNAGERLLEMVKKVLCVETPKSWLDYRVNEPEWIQFKFQKEEFDLEKLLNMCKYTKIITSEILKECKLLSSSEVEEKGKREIEVKISEIESAIINTSDTYGSIEFLSSDLNVLHERVTELRELLVGLNKM